MNKFLTLALAATFVSSAGFAMEDETPQGAPVPVKQEFSTETTAQDAPKTSSYTLPKYGIDFIDDKNTPEEIDKFLKLHNLEKYAPQNPQETHDQ